MAFLEIERISKSYGSHKALQDVSLSVEAGSIYGLLGPNGAGKSTLIRILNQILLPDSGEIRLDGRPLQREDIQRIGYLPEERGLYKKMKVGEQAVYLARLKGLSRQEATVRLKEWFERFGISEWWGKKVQELSKGMAQKVQFIVTVLHEPQLLIFDEPFSGFDPVNAQVLTEEILRLKEKGATILFSTHNMDSVEAMCDHITLINRSQNVLSGSVESIREQFAHPLYEVGYMGERLGDATQLPEGWTLSHLEAAGEVQRARIENQDPSADGNELLMQLVKTVEIEQFARIRPTMNDIFIRVVKPSQ
ncbi:MAG: ABC transporter ATP-binding protein [Bacteroidetes bacterium]|nr:MAG: ABC transporter ATP-binding protein [Bacteroidota bacterium]